MNINLNTIDVIIIKDKNGELIDRFTPQVISKQGNALTFKKDIEKKPVQVVNKLTADEEKIVRAFRSLQASHDGWECGQGLNILQTRIDGRECQVRIDFQYNEDEFEDTWKEK